MATPVTLIICNSNRALFSKVAEEVVVLLEDVKPVNVIFPRKSSEPTTPHTAVLEKFSNSEIHIDIGDNVRGHTVYVMQTEDQSADYTANDYLMELVLVISACKLASAATINAVIPSYFYARQDKKDRPRVPISARYVGDMIIAAGASRVICLDLHSSQIQGFLSIPVDNLYAIRYLRQHIETLITKSGRPRTDFVLIAPDYGCEKTIQAYSAAMRIPCVVAGKKRNHTKSSVIEKITLYGSTDCAGKIGIAIDDMIDTAGTIVTLARDLKEYGFAECWIAVTHGVLSGQAVDRLNSCDLITRVICTNTLHREPMRIKLPKLEIVDISELLARVIFAIETCGSISALFDRSDPPTPLARVKSDRLLHESESPPALTV